MNNYFILQDKYFEEPKTKGEIEISQPIKNEIDDFSKSLIDTVRYIKRSPKARVLGYVKKQN